MIPLLVKTTGLRLHLHHLDICAHFVVLTSVEMLFRIAKPRAVIDRELLRSLEKSSFYILLFGLITMYTATAGSTPLPTWWTSKLTTWLDVLAVLNVLYLFFVLLSWTWNAIIVPNQLAHELYE